MNQQQTRARVERFAHETVDVHLPVLVGLMAEDGQSKAEQSKRASRLVALLRGAEVVSSIADGGRPIPLELRKRDGGPQLVVNGEMLATVDNGALASAMADTIADILALSPVASGLVLQTSDETTMRGLAGQLGNRSDADIIALTEIEELVRWRLEMFEERLYAIVDGLGGWLESPVVPRDKFVESIAGLSTRWPQWRQIEDHDYAKAWLGSVDAELERTDWADSTSALCEMLWESVAISPNSALRQAAQTLRSLSTDGDRRRLLEVLADVVGAGDDAVDASLDAWPNLASLMDAWRGLWREEDDVLGARRRIARTPEVSVFAPPGESMGFSEPENLPWDQPLLCWTRRERDGLRDLIGGVEESLARQRRQVRVGRLSRAAGDDIAPPVDDCQDQRWYIEAPSRLPDIREGFSEAINIAYASLRAGFSDAFGNLDAASQDRALKLLRAGYSGYLQSTKKIWKRRLANIESNSDERRFDILTTGLADALEWPIFVDVFEEGVDAPALATMPSFTLPAVWLDRTGYAPVWIPIETIGEAIEQAPIRLRNIAVDVDDKSVRWLGDHAVEIGELEELKTSSLLRSMHEGTLLITVHRP